MPTEAGTPCACTPRAQAPRTKTLNDANTARARNVDILCLPIQLAGSTHGFFAPLVEPDANRDAGRRAYEYVCRDRRLRVVLRRRERAGQGEELAMRRRRARGTHDVVAHAARDFLELLQRQE